MKVSFTAMEHGTQADYDLVFAHEASIAAGQADRDPDLAVSVST